MNFVRHSLVIFLLMTSATCLLSQHFENVKTTFDGESVIITYDLVHTDANANFVVNAYSSHDRYSAPLQAVKGEVGDKVLPGKGHVIVWGARQALPVDFSSEVIIKLKGAPAAAAVRMEPLARSVYKKGEEVLINWKGGRPDDLVMITLTKNNSTKKLLVPSTANSHTSTWKIPNGIRAGKDYAVTVAKVGDNADTSTLQPFRIKARIPLWLKVLPVVAVGVVVGIVAANDGDDDLPEPPDHN
jgi:hypothetical protein